MKNRTIVIGVILGGLAMLAYAPMSRAQESMRRSKWAPWIGASIGTAAGFGLGMLTGLRFYDDAVNSDMKVWRSAYVGAAIGGVSGYLVGAYVAGPSSGHRTDDACGTHETAWKRTGELTPSRLAIDEATYRDLTSCFRATARPEVSSTGAARSALSAHQTCREP